MKAQFIYENIDFERGKEPKEAMEIGRESLIKKEFPTYFDAGDWAVRNLELITDDKYSPNDIIRKKGAEVMPKDLVDYLMKWVEKVKLTGYDTSLFSYDPVIEGPMLLQEIGIQLKKHGILVENLNFEREGTSLEKIGIGQEAINRADENILKVRKGTYEIIFSGFPGGSSYRQYKNTGKFIDVETQWAKIFGTTYVIPQELQKKNDQYDKRSPQGGGAYIINTNELSESLDFERGKDPKTAMGVGVRAILEPRKLSNIIGDHPHSQRIGRDIKKEMELPLSEIYSIWGPEDMDNEKLEKALDPYINGDEIEIIREVDYGTGVRLIKLATPHGELLREFSEMGTDNVFAAFDTVINLNILKYLG